MNTTALNRQFDSRALPGNAELANLRQRALERFTASGFPSRRHEDWRYTDLKPIADAGFDLAPAAPRDTHGTGLREFLARARLPHTGAALVFVDGVYEAGLSEPDTASAATLRSLAEHWDELDSSHMRALAESPHALAHLNTAFSSDGALIVVPKGVRVAEPVHLIFVGDRPGQAPQPRVIIDLEANAELNVVQHFVDNGNGAAWLNLVTQTRQAAGSKLTIYRLQEHGTAPFHTALLQATVGRHASLTAGYIDLGGKLVRNDVDVTLAEAGAQVDLFGLSLLSGEQHIDNHLRVDHAAPDTCSNEEFRAIVGDRGHAVFNGKVVVRRDSQRIDARQSSHNLLLSERAEINTKPELEIYADDVKCSHGATIGELDESQLFYLRARGVDESTARGLLTYAFANRVLDRIALDALRERVADRVAGQLPDRELWETLL